MYGNGFVVCMFVRMTAHQGSQLAPTEAAWAVPEFREFFFEICGMVAKCRNSREICPSACEICLASAIFMPHIHSPFARFVTGPSRRTCLATSKCIALQTTCRQRSCCATTAARLAETRADHGSGHVDVELRLVVCSGGNAVCVLCCVSKQREHGANLRGSCAK